MMPLTTLSETTPAQTVRVLARIVARPESTDQVRQILLQLIPPTRAESGCLQYDLWQDPCEPNYFMFVEAWQSDTELDAHLDTEHLLQAGEQLQGLLLEPVEIRRLQQIGPLAVANP